jgi:hypothetical protein
MRILFICGFLEKGACGVGDYTRRIAASLINSGHYSAIVALNDKFISQEYDGKQYCDGVHIPVLRIPSTSADKRRFKVATEWINEFDPEWLSLQFVLFSFDEKGLPFNIGNFLAAIGKGRRWNIMLHELWLGIEKEASFKIIMWGWIQKILIKSIILKLSPEIIHTQSQLHQLALNEINVKAELLPLISNIPVVKSEKLPQSEPTLKQISLVMFGSIYFGAPIAEFAKEAAEFATKHELKIKIISIGRLRRISQNWVQFFEAEQISVEMLGEQSEEFISEVLCNASFGISTTPYILAEKSGTVIAMLEHGLPVICVSRPYTVKREIGGVSVRGVLEYKIGKLSECLSSKGSFEGTNHCVSEVSHRFIKSLESK